jgi:hypothetical protein
MKKSQIALITGGVIGAGALLYYCYTKKAKLSAEISYETYEPAYQQEYAVIAQLPIFYAPLALRYNIAIKGGKPPYTVTIEYGDGTTETITTSATSILKDKRYEKVGTFAGKVTVRDSAGQVATARTQSFEVRAPEVIPRLEITLGVEGISQSPPTITSPPPPEQTVPIHPGPPTAPIYPI